MQTVAESVVLITSSDPTSPESGSGFVVHNDEKNSFVVTANHVIKSFPDKTIRVSGQPAKMFCSGTVDGIDLAVLTTKQLPHAKPLPLKDFVSKGKQVYGFAFQHLHGDHYVRRQFIGKIAALLSIQGRDSVRATPAWEIKAHRDHRVSAGNSGSPVLEMNTHKVVGILTHARNEGLVAVALAPSALRAIWPAFFDVREVNQSSPPEPPPPTSVDDPQHKRFGGKSKVGNRELIIAVTQRTQEYFYFDAIVRSTDGSPIDSAARFFLHDTYPKSVIWVRKSEGNLIALRDVYSYGVYTVGCQVKDENRKWVSLEKNLADLIPKRLPRRFDR